MSAAAGAPLKKKSAASGKSKAPSSHPPFAEMISDAIVTMKERTGSSQYAIQKFIESKHKQLPPTFRKLLLVQLKRLVASGKLTKIKNSYKLSAKPKPESKPKAAASKPRAKTSAKPKAAKASDKTKAAGVKRKASAKPKAVTAAKPKKVAKTSAKASPGKKMTKAVKPKKAAVKKVKSVKKSPATKTKK